MVKAVGLGERDGGREMMYWVVDCCRDVWMNSGYGDDGK
jgi:hypothetical protein